MEVSSTSSICSKPEQIMQNSPPIISSPRFQPQTRSPPNHHHDQHQHLSNPYPTTFVQADTSTFKQVVQMLTGSSTDTNTENHHKAPSPVNSNKGGFSIPPIKKTNSFKLYERRQNNNNNMFGKNDLMINTLRLQNSQRLMFSSGHNGHQSPRFSPRNSSSENVLLSPSMLDFPKLGLNSPVTPLRSNDDPSTKDKAIAEKGFYLHPSPVSTPRDSQPLLLPLFRLLPEESINLDDDPTSVHIL
ncbi:hypothetical protein Bca52824_022077 [Brassica carinata]|uniref:VQ domain-containing protein n=1 Tax=Brassica carinata TaxID=52824 RepID=A0A8X7VFJ0_BRACI|nr:hypothetical protein Bca52824_022077 [Brassica carinata]